MALVEDRFVEFNTTMSTLMGRVEDIDNHIEELKSMGDMEELRGEMETAMSSMVPNINKEIRSFQASEAANDGKLHAFKAEVKA